MTATPSSRSEWPPMYLVALCRTMSAPKIEGPLQDRRRERRIDDDARPLAVRGGGYPVDLGDVEQRVGEGIEPDEGRPG